MAVYLMHLSFMNTGGIGCIENCFRWWLDDGEGLKQLSVDIVKTGKLWSELG